ncbi:hypothetical protein, partial [Methanolobus psychrotolerans]|uniref:hypothetical protein n=1 Tax=Methanolobus psychrotolerans TaxID=1874706 RepID=UPI00101AE5C1
MAGTITETVFDNDISFHEGEGIFSLDNIVAYSEEDVGWQVLPGLVASRDTKDRKKRKFLRSKREERQDETGEPLAEVNKSAGNKKKRFFGFGAGREKKLPGIQEASLENEQTSADIKEPEKTQKKSGKKGLRLSLRKKKNIPS